MANTKHTLPGPRLLSQRYLLEKRLGRGAMGQVYLARDQNLVTRRVAVKTVRPDILCDEDLQEGEAVARFEREARAAASIQHPNVVDVTDFGKSREGVFFLVMEYVEGETLYQLLRREGTLNIQRATALLRQIVAGIEAAHDEGILHRDLKPANIFIMQQRRKSSNTADDGFVKVGDFGLAKIVHSDRSETQSGPESRGIIGTPEYMAPEQMKEGVRLDARADIYALGTIAYHMLGGRSPFTGNIAQLIAQKLLQAPPALTTLRSDISTEIDRAVMHALAKEPAERPASASEWLQEFELAVWEQSEDSGPGESRVVIMAPAGSEVYIDDERRGSAGRSGRVVLTSIAPGQHVLRVARLGEEDDERVIEIRPDKAEQVIQAQFKGTPSNEQLSPSKGGSLDSKSGTKQLATGVVVCTRCHSRFAEGTRFCGRCGNMALQTVPTSTQAKLRANVSAVASPPLGFTCPGCGRRESLETRFCGGCGIPIGSASLNWKTPKPVEVVCKTCGASYPAKTMFCGRCGKPISR
ncbi:MAG: protein kinase [Pyrinomonadaceae bacterium]|nr:protein kinase [Pyrinomonadaceae bacterium]